MCKKVIPYPVMTSPEFRRPPVLRKEAPPTSLRETRPVPKSEKSLNGEERIVYDLLKNERALAELVRVTGDAKESLGRVQKEFRKYFGKGVRRTLATKRVIHAENAAKIIRAPKNAPLEDSWRAYQSEWKTVHESVLTGVDAWEKDIARVFPALEVERVLQSMVLPRESMVMEPYARLVEAFGNFQLSVSQMQQYINAYRSEYKETPTPGDSPDPTTVLKIKDAIEEVKKNARLCLTVMKEFKDGYKEFRNIQEKPRKHLIAPFNKITKLDMRRVQEGGPERLDEVFSMVGQVARQTPLLGTFKKHKKDFGRFNRFVVQANASALAQNTLDTYGEKVTDTLEDVAKVVAALEEVKKRLGMSKSIPISRAKPYLLAPVERAVSGLLSVPDMPTEVRAQLAAVIRSGGAEFGRGPHTKLLELLNKFIARYQRLAGVLIKAEDKGWHRKGEVLRQPAGETVQ